jgi:hypothetical protein
MSETPELEESPRRRFRVTSNHIIIAAFAIEALVIFGVAVGAPGFCMKVPSTENED